jgi:predicted GTPase
MLLPALPILDDEIATRLRKSKKPVFVVVNKVDNTMPKPMRWCFTAWAWARSTIFHQ